MAGSVFDRAIAKPNRGLPENERLTRPSTAELQRSIIRRSSNGVGTKFLTSRLRITDCVAHRLS